MNKKVISHYRWYCKKCWKDGRVQMWHGMSPYKGINSLLLHVDSCPAKGTSADIVYIPL